MDEHQTTSDQEKEMNHYSEHNGEEKQETTKKIENPISSEVKLKSHREELDRLRAQGLVNLIGQGDATAQVVAKTMEDLLWRIEQEKEKEKVTLSLLSDARDRLMNLRRTLIKKSQLKSSKDQDLERVEWTLKQRLMRTAELKSFIEEVKQMEEAGSPYVAKIEEVEKKLDEAYEKANKQRNALIRACRRHDHLDMLITRSDEQEVKLKARIVELKKKIEYSQERKKRIKENALRSVQNAKDSFERCVDVEANNKRLSEKLRKVEIRVFELEEKVNNKEDSLRELRMSLRFRKLDLERAQTDLLIKKEKTERGMQTRQKAY